MKSTASITINALIDKAVQKHKRAAKAEVRIEMINRLSISANLIVFAYLAFEGYAKLSYFAG